jgi:hypothetical protein
MSTAARTRLNYAERILAGTTGVPNWPRCAIWLIRLALESALAQLWTLRCPELTTCSTRAQLLALEKFSDPDTTYRACELWHTLSRAAHHHHYELVPSTSEIREWLLEATEVLRQLEDSR